MLCVVKCLRCAALYVVYNTWHICCIGISSTYGLCYLWRSLGRRSTQSPSGYFAVLGQKLFIACTWHSCSCACLKFYCVAPCALCHYTHCISAPAVCIFYRDNGCHCLPVRILHYLLLILYAFTLILHTNTPSAICLANLVLLSAAIISAGWPPWWCLATVMLCCHGNAAFLLFGSYASNTLLWLYLSSGLCRAVLQSSCCFALSPPASP